MRARATCLACAGLAALAGCELVFPVGGGRDAGFDADPLIPDARLDAAPGDDDDGDGVGNGEDNCRDVANLDQHDHDLDGTGDVCDPCPYLGDAPDDVDDDFDQVGAGCDPTPTVPGSARLGFAGFYAAGDLDGWANQGGWAFRAGATPPEGTVAPLLASPDATLAPPISTGAFALTARLTVDSTGAADPAVGVGVRGNDDVLHACVLRLVDADWQLAFVTPAGNYQTPVTLGPSASATIRLIVTDSAFECSATPANCAPAALADSLSLQPLARNPVLYENAAVARVDYLDVIAP